MVPWRRGSFGHGRRAAFTLIETLVAVTLLSVGVVLVLQALTHGLAALDASRDSLRAAWGCREKLAELHVRAQQPGGVTPGAGHGQSETPFSDYTWRLRVEPASETDTERRGSAASNILMRVALDVSRSGSSRGCAMGVYALARKEP
jgi:prepilin-type N-terminal cleavage/methylation domain-containing protein